MSDLSQTDRSGYRLWVNAESTLLVRQWRKTGLVEIAERDDPGQVWGPPIQSSTLPSWIGNLIEQEAGR
jgi:hypothetical protein